MHDENNVIPLQMQRLTGSRVGVRKREDFPMGWQLIEKAPFGQDLQLSVIEDGQIHALAFPCRRSASGWLNGLTQRPVAVRPTHWRFWTGGPLAAGDATAWTGRDDK
jgi:hypothetical protein